MPPQKGPIKHGTLYAYKNRGCRCDECRAVNSARCREYHRSRNRMPHGNPCQRGDQSFKTQNDAAAAFGVSKSAISYHLNTHGNLDRLWTRSGGKNGGLKKPINIGGRSWPSRSALDRHLGLRIGTVGDWISRGQVERLIAAVMQAKARMAA